MAEAVQDENRNTSIQGVSSVDGVTPVNVYVNPTTGAVLTEAA